MHFMPRYKDRWEHIRLSKMEGISFECHEMSLPTAERECAAFCNFDNRAIFMIGGEKTDHTHSASDQVECFLVKQNYWVPAPALPEGVNDTTCCAVGESIYVLAGSAEPNDMNVKIFSFDARAYLNSLI